MLCTASATQGQRVEAEPRHELGTPKMVVRTRAIASARLELPWSCPWAMGSRYRGMAPEPYVRAWSSGRPRGSCSASPRPSRSPPPSATSHERRARGLFGDLRFTLTNTARSCHPERLVRGARSVVAAGMPLWLPAPERPGSPVGAAAALRLERPLPRAARAAAGASPTGSATPARAARCSSTRTTSSTARRPSAPASPSTARTRSPSSPARARSSRSARSSPMPSWSRRSRSCRPAAARARSASTPARPARWSSPACSTRPPASRPRPSSATRSPRRTLSRSTTASTAATSARTSAPGTPVQPAAAPTLEPAGEPWVSLRDWLEAPDDELMARYERLYVPDRDPRYLRRNALVALGNQGGEEAAALAAPYAAGGDPVLAPPARRVLERSGRRPRPPQGPASEVPRTSPVPDGPTRASRRRRQHGLLRARSAVPLRRPGAAIDTTTMEIHHDKHHKAYVDNVEHGPGGHAGLEAKRRSSSCSRDIDAGARGNPPGGPQQRRRPRQPHHVLGDHGPERRRRADRRPRRRHQGRPSATSPPSRRRSRRPASGRFGSGWSWLVSAGGKLAVAQDRRTRTAR